VQDARVIDKEHGVAYLRLTNFQKTTSRDVDSALWRLHREGMQCLIIDVRGNPGGLLTASVDLADKFVSAGNLVSTRGRSPREDFDYPAHTVGTWRVPLFVLIDGDTASASEIFAGAIRDHRRGTVIGQRSYGKGSVQGIFRLKTADVGVRLTTAKFYSPSGRAISNRGVSPDVPARVAAKPLADGQLVIEQDAAQDVVLNQAVQLARSRYLGQRASR
jgi:carboxyl-terminal processing protease